MRSSTKSTGCIGDSSSRIFDRGRIAPEIVGEIAAAFLAADQEQAVLEGPADEGRRRTIDVDDVDIGVQGLIEVGQEPEVRRIVAVVGGPVRRELDRDVEIATFLAIGIGSGAKEDRKLDVVLPEDPPARLEDASSGPFPATSYMSVCWMSRQIVFRPSSGLRR